MSPIFPPPESVVLEPPAQTEERALSSVLWSGILAPASLSAVGGYVDSAGFFALAGLFTSHVTGNLVVAGALMARTESHGVSTRVLALPVFMAAVAAATLLAESRRRHGRGVVSPLLWLETLVLGAFLALGAALAPALDVHPEGAAMIAVSMAGVAAMGVQNAVVRVALVGYAPTTAMTSNLTQLAADLSLMLREGAASPLHEERSRRLRKIGFVLLGFVAGASVGAWAMEALGFWCMLAPLLATAAMALAARRFEVA
jgi:uncharacterized membrane protein YoaK (UPF0700 family)